jgi:hypothetical protein
MMRSRRRSVNGLPPGPEGETPLAQVVQRDRLPRHLLHPPTGSGVTIGPIRSLSVDEAIAVSATHTSATGRSRGG